MTSNQLERARALALPQREAMLRRDSSVEQFWTVNRALLVDAWSEWDETEATNAGALNSSLIHKDLRVAVTDAWDDPSKESAVRDLMQEPVEGVFSFQFFDPEKLADLRDYLEQVWDAGIPLRPPYGIVLNRKGAMLDNRSTGCLAAPSFQDFYSLVMDTYMRPISRLLFPEIVGYDTQTFGFSINYQPNTDTSIRPHSDASAVTLNINLNLPDEQFTGSTVDFLDSSTGQGVGLTFEPGTAMIHRGLVPHAAQPITSGERTNFVLWLFGEGGAVPPQWNDSTTASAAERWTVPNAPQDFYAPF